jgi:hypothetical protein
VRPRAAASGPGVGRGHRVLALRRPCPRWLAVAGSLGYLASQNLDAKVSSRLVSGPVTVGTNNDKTGYSLNLAQVVPTSNTAQTVGDALNAARAQGFGKWVLLGTSLTLYAGDGATVVRTFTLDSATAPTQSS